MQKANIFLLSQELIEHYFDQCNIINEGFNYFNRINLFCRNAGILVICKLTHVGPHYIYK